MKKSKIEKLQLNAQTVRHLNAVDLGKACGGAIAQSGTDEMGECVCVTQTFTLGLDCWPDIPF